VALIAITVLAATGTYSAFRGIGSVDAIFRTSYGLLVVLKVTLLAMIVAAAALARRMVQRRTIAYAMTDAGLDAAPNAAPDAAPDGELLDDSPDASLPDDEVMSEDDLAVERLRRSVFVEAILAFVVLAITALLVSQPRGKEALAAQYRKPVSATAPLSGNRTVTVTADPGTHGSVNLTVELSTGTAPPPPPRRRRKSVR
jgi:copper transport protein